MPAKTIKARRHGVVGVVGYYAGLAPTRRGATAPVGARSTTTSTRPSLRGGGGDPAGPPSASAPRWPPPSWRRCWWPAIRSAARLGKAFGDRSARAYDATFSAPKSVSLLWALSDDGFLRAEVLAAHDTAVEAALAWFERHGAVTRRGTDGVHQVDTGGVAVAVFRQHTSRSADPQLHTHALVMAKVQDPTGEWLSLDARFLKAQQRSIGWVYAAALRSELTARLGVAWGEVTEGHADIVGVRVELMKVFSARSAQVKARLGELVANWMADHDGAEPDPRTLYRLERRAAVDSRPDEHAVGEAEALRADWRRQAAEAGVGAIDLPTITPELPGMAVVDRRGVVAEALARVAAQSSTWLHADLSREIATLLPACAAASATGLVELVEELTAVAAAQCVGLQPERPVGVARRRDGRPVAEAVVERHLTTAAILHQEARLLAWADSAAGPTNQPNGEDAQAAVAQAVAGDERLVLVVGPAGTGKTTALGMAARMLADQGRPAIGLAPSGKAADVIGAETGWPATTLAKLLHDARSGREPVLPPGTTVVLDEAGMAATDDLDALVGLVERHRWRLVCVGDPAQLPAVGRGGMFELWCERVGAYSLDAVRRFEEGWQTKASLALRRGERAAAAAHGRLVTVHPALLAERVARIHQNQAAKDNTVAITAASAGTAREINVAIQRRRSPRRAGASVTLADGTAAFAGDRGPPGATTALAPTRATPCATARPGRWRRWASTAHCSWSTRPGAGCGYRVATWPATWSWAGP